jgi:hypothetical protein
MTTRALTSIAIIAKDIRNKLKAAGVKARVLARNYSMGSSLDVYYVSGGYTKCKEIAETAQSIRYDDASGEILSGGNRFVHINMDHDTVKALEGALFPAVAYACESLEGRPVSEHANVEYIGRGDITVAREGYGFGLWIGHEHCGSHPHRDAEEVAYYLAHNLMRSS